MVALGVKLVNQLAVLSLIVRMLPLEDRGSICTKFTTKFTSCLYTIGVLRYRLAENRVA
jgi:hypothetical protein